jgi:hypothetical protein
VPPAGVFYGRADDLITVPCCKRVEAIARSVQEGIAMHPMKEFDPTKPAMVHDRLNDRTFEWKPATMQANYEKYAETFGPDVIEWDGLLLDGWLPLGAQPSSQP